MTVPIQSGRAWEDLQSRMQENFPNVGVQSLLHQLKKTVIAAKGALTKY